MVSRITYSFADGGGSLFDSVYKLTPLALQSIRLVDVLAAAVGDRLDVALELVPEL